MAVTAELVRELRERTGAGMMECKKALEASSGDINVAIEAMRKAGQAKADKKSGRVAAEGIIVINIQADGKAASIVEVNCETDFVGRDSNFKQFAEGVANTVLTQKAKDVTTLMDTVMDGTHTIEQARQALVAKIGENIQVRRGHHVTATGVLGSYVHGGRIGVLVELQGGDAQLAKDIAMHIAANSPLVITREEVPADIIAKEKEIFSAQAQASGKPAAVIEKMIEGRINKYLDEVSLLGQPFVKDPNMTVAQLLDKSKAKVNSFVRFAVGEGIEKETENFVDAVMAQVKAS